MTELLHKYIEKQAATAPKADALFFKNQTFNYSELNQYVNTTAKGLIANGLITNERVAIYLPKLPEAVFTIFGTAAAGGVFVPINPLLKPKQVAYILQDCNVRFLITSAQRLNQLKPVLSECSNIKTIVTIEENTPDIDTDDKIQVISWKEFSSTNSANKLPVRIDTDMVSILYTSGSTGNPKGVVLSHKNMMMGAKSVANYLNNSSKDCLLAVLPLSFDYGLSQLTTAFSVGASVVLMDYLLPADIIRAITRYNVTGLAAVPPIWNQLAQLEWPEQAAKTLRYITNSGGAMPKATSAKLAANLPNTDIFLMYGLTEAFRSTYLPPEQASIRPDSIGKAIPNAEIVVINENGQECEPNETGELVHLGSLVAMGYWNDAVKTAERFKPSPIQQTELPLTDIAVWSGDQVRKDAEGYLYFVSRNDEMIKTSGYRVSPTEVEEVVYGLDSIKEVAATGLPHPTLGQAILLVISCNQNIDDTTIMAHCKKELPSFMIPQAIIIEDQLPKNPNGKIDRKLLSSRFKGHFLKE